VLEHPHFPHFILRNPARGDIRNASVFKLKPGIRDIDRFGHDRDAVRIDPCNRRPHETQNDIDIMNHEIENDGNIGAARVELREPVGFDEHRSEVVRLKSENCRVKPFNMSDLDEASL